MNIANSVCRAGERKKWDPRKVGAFGDAVKKALKLN